MQSVLDWEKQKHVLCKDSHVPEIHLKIKIERCMSGTLTVCQLQTNFPKAVKQDYATTRLSEGWIGSEDFQ